MKLGDKLLCTHGNGIYIEGGVYTVGNFINDRYFELFVDATDDCWYATIDNQGICVHFDTNDAGYPKARFVPSHQRHTEHEMM